MYRGKAVVLHIMLKKHRVQNANIISFLFYRTVVKYPIYYRYYTIHLGIFCVKDIIYVPAKYKCILTGLPIDIFSSLGYYTFFLVCHFL